MNQELALAILLSGKSALLTGAAGTGKTHLLNTFIHRAKKRGKSVAITATTGLAATHLGGKTIHSWSGIGVRDELPPTFLDNIPKTRVAALRKADVLIIDEISMLHSFQLDMIDKILRKARQKDCPFGDLQVVMSGDFFQLPPISRGDSMSGNFIVHSQVWQENKPVVLYLEKQYRQDDEILLDILSALRAGDVRRRHAQHLLDRVNIEPEDDSLTELHTVNVDVDRINMAKLSEIDAEEKQYRHFAKGSRANIETLKRSVLAPEVLILKKGALVMAVKNSKNEQYVNGSIGTVVGFDRETTYPIVAFKNGREVLMMPDIWELIEGDKRRASITQVPLRLAWAITVHKSQGMTLDTARIDLRKAFVKGMGYVALSRVRNIENLYLYGINRTALEVSDDALAIDKDLKESSENAARDYQDLLNNFSADEDDEPVADEKKPAKTSWMQKIEKMREEHPNAYRPWEKEQDKELRKAIKAGISVEKMSQQFGRHKTAIVRRAEKLCGETVADKLKRSI